LSRLGQVAVLFFCSTIQIFAVDTLVATGSVWKYLDNGSDQGTIWREPSFNDSGWPSGPAQLGYGDGDELTVLHSGPVQTNKYITSYFRHAFQVDNPGKYTSALVSLLRDDGGVVYLNGREVFRSNMPETNINYRTLAANVVGPPEESYYYSNAVAVSNLLLGVNVLAVEIHQSGPDSSDISFDLSFTASTVPLVLRGPYLQSGTPTSAIIRWRTDVPTDSRVQFGTSNLTFTAGNPLVTTEHIVTINGLSPGTKYFYSIGDASGALASDPGFFFVTSPPPGLSKPTRLWVLGDSGTASSDARNARDAYLGFAGTRPADLVLMLGDNAYDTGQDNEYQAAVFQMYPMVLKNTFLWPTIGNHDSAFSYTATNFPYLDIFSLPSGGEAGGIPSGTAKYYSFDYANAHFICLDSMTSNTSTNGPMMTWLRNDLAATTQAWIIAFWHHPPYSKGSHDSDKEFELIEMRTNALPILEAGGVDLVLCGHSHSYERSFLINGHYGLSSTFIAEMEKDGGDGRIDGTGAYQKPAGISSHQGIIYTVAGSSGHIEDGGTLDHPAMYTSLEVVGSVVLDLNSNRLDGVFLNTNGVTQDHFTLVKGQTPTLRPAAPTNLLARQILDSQVLVTWANNATNEAGYKLERSTNGVNFAQVCTTGANVTNRLDSGLAMNATYYYRVRASNLAGDSPYSPMTSLHLLPPPVLRAGPAPTNGVFQLTLSGQRGQKYLIEQSSNCRNWTTLTTVSNITGQVQFSDSNTSGAKFRFYRAQVAP